MNRIKALWEKGDFTQIAALMRESGEAVVQSLGIKPPLRALGPGLRRWHHGGSARPVGG